MQKELYRYVSKPQKGRRWVVGDVHGCAQTLRNLLFEKIRLSPEDQLFFVGDYINRGPDSLGVIDLILDLKAQNYQIFTLKGNHEQMFLDSLQRDPSAFVGVPRLHKKANLSEAVQDQQGQWIPKYKSFFEDLLYYIDTGDFYLSHAGLKFSAPNPLEDYEGMLWVRKFTPDESVLGGRRLVHGHTRYDLSQIREAISEKAAVIPIDNGCYEALQRRLSGKNPERGNLCALCLDSLELMVQENIDKQ